MKPSTTPVIGGDATRIDALAKVTGQARYAEDIKRPDLLHARVLRSPHHHARLISLDTGKAAQLPGIVRVLTAADIPGENGLFDYSREEPVLTPIGATVRMIGAPVAFVVADTSEHAQAGIEAIQADYEILPHSFDTAETLSKEAFPICGENNVLTSFTVKHGDLEAAFEQADLIYEARYHTTFLEHCALEREAAFGYLDEQERITVVCGTHEPHWQQNYIAGVLAIDPSQVRVITPPTGGSFGGKQDPWPHVATGLMVYYVRQPVRLAYSRHESFDASPKRHPYEVDYQIGATEDGHLTGIRVRINVNTGGYDGHGQYIPNYAAVGSGGPYLYKAVDAHAQSIYTNGPKGGQFRGFGTSQPTFALESTLDELIETLNDDPIDFRLRNRIHQDSISFLGYPVAESLGYAEVLEAIRPRYREFMAEAEAFNAGSNGPLRKGIGLAGMWYRFGKSGQLRVETHAELAEDGHFIARCSAPDYGQGIGTVMVQLAAETLGVSRDRVELINADTALTPDSGIQGASRATYWIGNSLCDASRNLKTGILATAAEMMDCDPADLLLTDSHVKSKSDSSKAISLQEVAQEFDRQGRSRRAVGIFDLTPNYPEDSRPEYTPHFVTGTHLAEVIVDTETGLVEVPRMVAAHDVGRAINPPGAQGQIEGAILMGLGIALTEQYIPGKTTGFTDYVLPMVSAVPKTEVILVEVSSYQGPYGAKGLGEAAMLPSTPAIINAISRAIGIRIREVPAVPWKILDAIGAKKP